MVDTSANNPVPDSEHSGIVGYSNRREAIYKNALPPDLLLDTPEPYHIRRRRLKPINERMRIDPGLDWLRDFPVAYYGSSGRISFSAFTLPKPDINETLRQEDVDVFIGATDHFTALRVVTGLESFGELNKRHAKVDLSYRHTQSGMTIIIARFRIETVHHVYYTPNEAEIEAVLKISKASYYDFYGNKLFVNPYKI